MITRTTAYCTSKFKDFQGSFLTQGLDPLGTLQKRKIFMESEIVARSLGLRSGGHQPERLRLMQATRSLGLRASGSAALDFAPLELSEFPAFNTPYCSANHSLSLAHCQKKSQFNILVDDFFCPSPLLSSHTVHTDPGHLPPGHRSSRLIHIRSPLLAAASLLPLLSY